MKKLIAAVFGLVVLCSAASADAHWRKCYYPPVAYYAPPPMYACGPAGCAPRVGYVVPRVAYAVPYVSPYAYYGVYGYGGYGYGYAPAYYRGW